MDNSGRDREKIWWQDSDPTEIVQQTVDVSVRLESVTPSYLQKIGVNYSLRYKALNDFKWLNLKFFIVSMCYAYGRTVVW